MFNKAYCQNIRRKKNTQQFKYKILYRWSYNKYSTSYFQNIESRKNNPTTKNKVIVNCNKR